MLAPDLSRMHELEGQLIGLSDNAILEGVLLDLSTVSKGNISTVIKEGRVERAYQDNIVTELRIKEEDRSVFVEGQNTWVKQGSTYVMTDRPSNPKRFKAVLRTAAPAQHTNTYYVYDVWLGNISFDLSNCNCELDDGEVVYTNVPMTIYPGTYRAAEVE